MCIGYYSSLRFMTSTDPSRLIFSSLACGSLHRHPFGHSETLVRERGKLVTLCHFVPPGPLYMEIDGVFDFVTQAVKHGYETYLTTIVWLVNTRIIAPCNSHANNYLHQK